MSLPYHEFCFLARKNDETDSRKLALPGDRVDGRHERGQDDFMGLRSSGFPPGFPDAAAKSIKLTK
jgi:hypothetical protein